MFQRFLSDSVTMFVVGSSRADSEKSESQKSESTWLPGQKLVVMRALRQMRSQAARFNIVELFNF